MKQTLTLSTFWLVGFLAIALPLRAADVNPIAADEELLRSAKLGTDGPALLEFFRQLAF